MNKEGKHYEMTGTPSRDMTEADDEWGCENVPDAKRRYDPVTFDLLKVPVEEIAAQITLRDLPIFKAITAEELASGGWTSRTRKETDAPNIVDFTYQFNVNCLWCQQEILTAVKPSRRVALLEYFIHLAKKLLHLGNIHTTFAIVSALLGHSVYRLKNTWSRIGRSERSAFEKMDRLFASDNNWERLRHLTEERRKQLPAIPYLGLFLTDLSFLQDAMKRLKPSPGTPNAVVNGVVDERRMCEEAMNKIIRSIAAFQDSNYGTSQMIV
jgi:hypothetical protein